MADVTDKISQDILNKIAQIFNDDNFIINAKKGKKNTVKYIIKLTKNSDLNKLKKDLSDELENLPDLIKNIENSKKVSDIWDSILANLNTRCDS